MSDKKNYRNLSVEELINHQGFISEIRKRDNTSWSDFLDLNSENKANLIEAKRWVELFKVQEETLDNVRKINLWNRISESKKEYNQRRLKRKILLKVFIL